MLTCSSLIEELQADEVSVIFGGLMVATEIDAELSARDVVTSLSQPQGMTAKVNGKQSSRSSAFFGRRIEDFVGCLHM